MVLESRSTTPLPSRPPFTAVPTPSSPPAAWMITWEDAQGSAKSLKQETGGGQGVLFCTSVHFTGWIRSWQMGTTSTARQSTTGSHASATSRLNERLRVSKLFNRLSAQLKPVASWLELKRERIAEVQLCTWRFATFLNQFNLQLQ